MGGFHGGHSGGGGGGFHGGGYHGGGGGGYSRPPVVHTVKNGHHYYNGVRYYGGYYGLSSEGKPMSFGSTLGVGFLLCFIGLFIFYLMFTVRSTATITHVAKMHDYSGSYVSYDFDYDYLGTTYSGEGDDDDDTFAVGQTYPVYVHICHPSNYEFSNNNGICFFFSGAFLLVGVVILANACKGRREYEAVLKSVGDANKDGIVDEKDIEYHEKMLEEKAEEDSQRAANKSYKESRKDLKCPYCDSVVSVNDRFCQNCGAALGRK